MATMTKKEANALMRSQYGASWFERADAKDERDGLMRGKTASRVSTSTGKSTKPRAAAGVTKSKPARPAAVHSTPTQEAAQSSRLWNNEGSSDKVYELDQSGTSLIVRWGRRGSKLQSKMTAHSSPQAAAAEFAKIRRAKMASGYREISRSRPGAEDIDEAEGEEEEPEAPARSRASASQRAQPRRTLRTADSPPSGVMLAKTWSQQDPTGWWMSEKLDGMRAYWSGSTMYTRTGNVVAIPDSLAALLPSTALDGELFLGRGKFQDAISIVRKMAPTDPRWSQIRYMVFDAPEISGTFETRMEALRGFVETACRQVRGPCPLMLVEQTKCTGPTHLKRFHAEIAVGGGEGVMLRKPKSAYARVRTPDLLKVKDFMDAEATITGYTKGTGKHAGRLGAYTARLLESGVEFKIGTGISDDERNRPKRIGTVVTVRFQELTRDGVPRFPSLVGARDYE